MYPSLDKIMREADMLGGNIPAARLIVAGVILLAKATNVEPAVAYDAMVAKARGGQ